MAKQNGDRAVMQNAVKKLVNLDMSISRPLRIIGSEIHARKNYLGDISLDRLVNLLHNSRNRNGTLGAAGFPNNAIRASMVATVLNFYTPA